jgi:hypothetical protein
MSGHGNGRYSLRPKTGTITIASLPARAIRCQTKHTISPNSQDSKEPANGPFQCSSALRSDTPMDCPMAVSGDGRISVWRVFLATNAAHRQRPWHCIAHRSVLHLRVAAPSTLCRRSALSRLVLHHPNRDTLHISVPGPKPRVALSTQTTNARLPLATE